MKEKLTPGSIRAEVARIATLASDDERAHSQEDMLYIAVLNAIAQGSTSDPAACASEALEARKINFARWCA